MGVRYCDQPWLGKKPEWRCWITGSSRNSTATVPSTKISSGTFKRARWRRCCPACRPPSSTSVWKRRRSCTCPICRWIRSRTIRLLMPTTMTRTSEMPPPEAAKLRNPSKSCCTEGQEVDGADFQRADRYERLAGDDLCVIAGAVSGLHAERRAYRRVPPDSAGRRAGAVERNHEAGSPSGAADTSCGQSAKASRKRNCGPTSNSSMSCGKT